MTDKDGMEGDNKNVLGIYCNFSANKINDDQIHKFTTYYPNLKFDTIIFVVYPDKSKPG